MGIRSSTESEDVFITRVGEGSDVDVVVRNDAELKVRVVRRNAVNHNVGCHDEEEEGQEDDRADAAPEGEGAVPVVKGGLERRLRELYLRGQIRAERRDQSAQALRESGAWRGSEERYEELALEHGRGRSHDDGRKFSLFVNQRLAEVCDSQAPIG